MNVNTACHTASCFLCEPVEMQIMSVYLSVRNSPYASIRSSSDLLQANVLFWNFPNRTVDLLSTEFHPWLHLAVKENRQKSNVHRYSYAIFCIRAPKGHCVGTILFHANIKRPFMWFYVVRIGRSIDDVWNHEPLKLWKRRCNRTRWDLSHGDVTIPRTRPLSIEATAGLIDTLLLTFM